MDTEPNEVVINGVTYAPVSPLSDDIRICVLDRGWVVVGRYEVDGDMRRVHNGAVIRIWGTTKGLPELVNGPIADKTKLDKCDTPIEFNRASEILTIRCNPDGWTCLG